MKIPCSISHKIPRNPREKFHTFISVRKFRRGMKPGPLFCRIANLPFKGMNRRWNCYIAIRSVSIDMNADEWGVVQIDVRWDITKRAGNSSVTPRLKMDNKQVDVWTAISQRSDTRLTVIIDQLDPWPRVTARQLVDQSLHHFGPLGQSRCWFDPAPCLVTWPCHLPAICIR